MAATRTATPGGPPNSGALMIRKCTFDEFAKGFRNCNQYAVEHENPFLMNMGFPLYSGLDVDYADGDEPGEYGRDLVPTRVNAETPVNLGKVANLDKDLAAAVLQAHGFGSNENCDKAAEKLVGKPCEYAGRATLGDGPGTPVLVDAWEDLSKGSIDIGIHADFKALAAANYEERAKYRAANPEKFAGAPPLPPAGPGKRLPPLAERLPVSVKYPVMKHAIAGFAPDKVSENAVRAAAVGYLMTASKRDPDRSLPSQQSVSAAMDTVNRCFQDVIEMGRHKGCKGIPKVRMVDGKRAPTHGVIHGTDFPSFKEMGIEAVTDRETGAMFLVVPDSTARQTKKAREEGLRGMATALNAMLVQAAGASDDKLVKNLTYATKFEFYPTRPRFEGHNTIASAVMPAMRMEFTPYASAVHKSAEVVLQNRDPREAFSERVVDNARRLMADAGLETDPKKLGAQAKDREGAMDRRAEEIKKGVELGYRIGVLGDDHDGFEAEADGPECY